jgi:hypothetical protein
MSLTSFVLTMAAAQLLGAADEPDRKGLEPDALRLFREIVKTYRDMTFYSDQGQFGFSLVSNDIPQDVSYVERLRFARPNRIDYRTPGYRLLCDGKVLRVTTPVCSFGPGSEVVRSATEFTYKIYPAPQRLTTETITASPGLNLFFDRKPWSLPTDPQSLPTKFLLTLLLDGNPEGTILKQVVGLRIEPDAKLGGKRVRSLFIDLAEGSDLRLLVDPNTKRIERIECVFDPKILGLPEMRFKILVFSYGWTAGAISTRPLGADDFSFKPTKDTREVFSDIDLFIVEGAPPGQKP